MDELISVVIPFYRNKIWLKEAIDSVLQQTYSPIEIIVINDGSQEDVEDIVEEYHEKIRYLYQENGGAAHARNIGIDMATGDYIAFLDSDDLWESTKVEKQLMYMKNNGYLWSTTYYGVFGNGANEKSVLGKEKEGNIFPYPVISCAIATPCVMIRSDVIRADRSYRFEETLKVGEDTLLWLRLSKNYALGVVPEKLVYVRMHGDNAANNYAQQIMFRKYVVHMIESNQDIWSAIKFKVWTRVGYKLISKLKEDKGNVQYFIARILFKIDKLLYCKTY